MDPKLFVATKAFINHSGRILILRESSKYDEGTNAGRYDIAGGRLKPGERFDESLRREVKEEAGLEVKIGNVFFVNEWQPAPKGELWQVVGIFFECFANLSEVTLGEDHDKCEWIDPSEYKNYNLIPNLHAAFEAYLQREK